MKHVHLIKEKDAQTGWNAILKQNAEIASHGQLAGLKNVLRFMELKSLELLKLMNSLSLMKFIKEGLLVAV